MLAMGVATPLRAAFIHAGFPKASPNASRSAASASEGILEALVNWLAMHRAGHQ